MRNFAAIILFLRFDIFFLAPSRFKRHFGNTEAIKIYKLDFSFSDEMISLGESSFFFANFDTISFEMRISLITILSKKVYVVFALVVVAASFGVGNFVVSNSLRLPGMNTFSKVLTTFGLEKNPITLAVFVPTFRKL